MQTGIELRLAVLIDADNVPHDRINGMMKEIARYGTPTIKRIYGDWTKPDLKGWKNILLSHAITPIQQYRYTVGKNATDSAMIIEAMDMLYGGNVDGFFIVSSDSDFTRLALRLRESGRKVFGMGERKTPKPFIVACDKFIYIEIIDMIADKPEPEPPPLKRVAGAKTAKPSQPIAVKGEPSARTDAGRAAGTTGSSGKGEARHESRPESSRAQSAASHAAPATAELRLADSRPAEGKNPDAKPTEGREGETRQPVTLLRPEGGRSRRSRRKGQKPESRTEPAAAAGSQAQASQATSVTDADSGDKKHAAASPESHEIPAEAPHGAEETTAARMETSEPERRPVVEAVTQEIIDLIASSITDLADENGWAFLGDVGTLIAKKQPDFDPRNYGFMKLTPLVRSLDAFELDIRETSQFHIKHVYIRNRRS